MPSDGLHVVACSSCGELITFCGHHRTGHAAPITIRIYDDGNVEILDRQTYRIVPKGERANYPQGLRKNHFSNCAFANDHKGD